MKFYTFLPVFAIVIRQTSALRMTQDRDREPEDQGVQGRGRSYRIIRQEDNHRYRHSDFPLLYHTDCHSSVAARLDDRCELEGARGQGRSPAMTEGERSDVAISLTICSMSSALQPIPSECLFWTYSSMDLPKDGKNGWSWRNREDKGNEKMSRSMCLSALHRSPQDWTTYNNYLGDALKLCHALRSQHAEDTAHQLYRNATQRQLEVLDLIKQAAQHKAADDAEQSDAAVAQLQKSEQAIIQVGNLIENLQRRSDDAHMAVDEIRSVVGEFGSAGAAIWRDVQDEARRNSDMLLRQVAVGLEDVKALFAQELALELQGVASQHAESMSQDVLRNSEQMGQYLASAETRLEAVVKGVSGRIAESDLAIQQWSDSMRQAQDNMAALAEDARVLQPTLRESVESALNLRDTHTSLSDSMQETSSISRAISQSLANTLLEINSTLSEIEIWRSQAAAPVSWWRARPGLALFSTPALLDSPKLTSLLSPASLKALALTADLSLGWAYSVLSWTVTTAVSLNFFQYFPSSQADQLASILASLLIMLWMCTSNVVSGQIRRLWRIAKQVAENNERDPEIPIMKLRSPTTPYSRLASLGPPAYTSPHIRATHQIEGALEIDLVPENSLDRVKEVMLKRSYGNLRRGMGQRRGRRAVSAPPI